MVSVIQCGPWISGAGVATVCGANIDTFNTKSDGNEPKCFCKHYFIRLVWFINFVINKSVDFFSCCHSFLLVWVHSVETINAPKSETSGSSVSATIQTDRQTDRHTHTHTHHHEELNSRINHSLVFHWTRRFVSKCQLKIFCLFTFCQNTKAIAFVFLGLFWGQNTSLERNLMTPCATCRVPLGMLACKKFPASDTWNWGKTLMSQDQDPHQHR